MPSQFDFILMLARSETERLLTERLGTQGVKVERGPLFTSLVERPDSVEVTLAAPDGTVETVQASYLIAADGSHSPVRKSLGVPFTGRSLPQTYVLGDLHLDGDVPEDPAVDLPGGQRVSRGVPDGSGLVPVHGDRSRPELELTVPDQQPTRGHAAPGPGLLRR